MNYESASKLLTGRCHDRRKIANNTYLERKPNDMTSTGEIAVRLHSTDILIYYPDGSLTLNSGGWRTPTTKQRLNEYLETGYVIRQERGQWYLVDMVKRGPVCMFEDNMVIHADGTVTGGKPLDAVKAELKVRRQAMAYGKAFVAALVAGKVPAPSNGDCWFCMMRETTGTGTQIGTLHPDGKVTNAGTVQPGMTGKTWGEVSKDSSHILSHIEEKYFVPSLLVRAFEVMPVSQVMKWAVAEKWYPEQMGREPGKEYRSFLSDGYTDKQIAKTISRYVLRQIGQAS